MKTRILSAIMILVMMFGLCACGGRDGDGITTCKNCGNKRSLSSITGLCSTCDKGFWEWQEKTYGD